MAKQKKNYIKLRRARHFLPCSYIFMAGAPCRLFLFGISGGRGDPPLQSSNQIAFPRFWGEGNRLRWMRGQKNGRARRPSPTVINAVMNTKCRGRSLCRPVHNSEFGIRNFGRGKPLAPLLSGGRGDPPLQASRYFFVFCEMNFSTLPPEI